MLIAAVIMLLVAGCQTSTRSILLEKQLSHPGTFVNQKKLNGEFKVLRFNDQFLPGIAYFTVEAKVNGKTVLFSAATTEMVSRGESVDIVEVDMSGLVPLQYYDDKKHQPVLFIKKKAPLK